jgi:Tfp pilus assembly protein PilO
MPFILVGAALGLFVLYTNPSYQKSKAIAAEVSAYDNALTKSKELLAARDKLNSKRNTFPADGVAKLSKVLPDNVDNIRLVIDINNIASKHNLSIKNAGIGTVSDTKKSSATLASGAPGGAVGSVETSFSVSASYDDMLAFLADLERSLRIIDIQSLSFSAGDTADYSIGIRTYWLH